MATYMIRTQEPGYTRSIGFHGVHDACGAETRARLKLNACGGVKLFQVPAMNPYLSGTSQNDPGPRMYVVGAEKRQGEGGRSY